MALNLQISKIGIDKLNNAMVGLKNKSGAGSINSATRLLIDQQAAVSTTTLGAKSGDIVGGFKSLTQEIDTADLLAGQKNVVSRGIAIVSDNPPGVNLKRDIVSVNIDLLKTLTGLVDDIAPGINAVAVSLATPEAVGAILENISDKKASELSDAMGSIAPTALAALASSTALKQLASDGNAIFGEFSGKISIAIGGVTSFLDKGFGQPLKDLIEAVGSPINSVVTQLTQDSGKLIPKNIQKQFTGLIDQANALGAAKLLSGYSVYDVATMETALSGVSTKVGDLVNGISTALDTQLPKSNIFVNNLGSQDKSWNGSSTTIRSAGANGSGYSFTRISRQEEIEAEIRTATREITEVVIHWTEHFADQDVGSEEIHKTHSNGIGYHYVIRKDGTIQRGRPINIEGEHAPAFGHNKYSIGLAIVGGFTCNSGTPDPERYLSAESINSSQQKALEDFLRMFYRVFPGGEILGHYHCTDNDDIDPGFDVETYIKETFGKQNATSYGDGIAPLSRKELIDLRSNKTISSTTASTKAI
tara:strand:- start:22562 stop:24157 length:1596 start_codon:yes stop_codon:yes gene_type:complete